MEHKGIPFSAVQTANPTGWKWTVDFPGRKPKSGVSANRVMAIRAAKIAIDHAIKVKPAKQSTTQ
jgi:hypothetical protein